jgi:hypothetical protein
MSSVHTELNSGGIIENKAPYTIFVINISDERWENYKDDDRYRRWKGVNGNKELDLKDVNDKYHFYWNCNDTLKLNVAGCSESHLRCIKHIYDNKINNAIIIEDDTFVDFERLELCPLYNLCDGITYLGGQFHPPVLKNLKTFEKEGRPEYEKGILSLRRINTSSFLISGAFGYYIPKWEQALILTEQTGKKRRAIDVEFKGLQKKDKIKSFIFPALVTLNIPVAMTGFTFNKGRYKLPNDFKYY